MSNVVYLISSLPSLTYGKPAPVSMDEFMRDAQNQLSDDDYDKLEALDIRRLDKNPETGKLKSVLELFDELQTDKFEIREAKKLGRSPNVLTISKKVLDQNPLEIEEYFMETLWDELHSVESTESFTLTEVFVYKLKLQILERLDSFNTEKGLEILEKVVNPPKEEAPKEEEDN